MTIVAYNEGLIMSMIDFRDDSVLLKEQPEQVQPIPTPEVQDPSYIQ